MRQIQKRIQKLQAAIRPDDDTFTFEELCRSYWQGDRKAFQELVKQDPLFGIYVTQFELEEADALRAANWAKRHEGDSL